MRIHALDQNLANQIAAGEVVERPASVIKELCENSIDAEANEIVIEVKQGGLELIRVTDNGVGIHREDLALALQRSSTSKIRSQADLNAIATMGFRGEALASIAAVSRFKMTSRQASDDIAHSVQAEGAGPDSTSIAPIAHPVGTCIEVKDLFFNTPARRKFLRTARTEFFQIESVVQRLALSDFSLAIKLIHNDKIVLDLPIADTVIAQEKRVGKLLGHEFMEQAIAIDFSAADLHLSGWIALPLFTRAQIDMQYFFLNHRVVRDKVLSHAVRAGYEDVLFHGRHPAYVLYLACDPHKVDVNVHPTKQEIRLHDGRLVHDFIVKGIRDALSQAGPSTEKIQPPPLMSPAPYRIQEPSPKQYHAVMEFHQPEPKLKPKPTPVQVAEPSMEENVPKPVTHRLGYAIGQVKDIYIAAQNDKGLVLVDMHAAHERILYEKMKKQIDRDGIQTQPLLLPMTIQLSPQEMRCYETHQNVLNRLGLQLETAGPTSIVVRSVPTIIKDAKVEALIKDTLSDLQDCDQSQRIENTLYSVLGNVACKSAVKANHRLSIPEMNAILRDMEETPNSGFCNHGRPTWIEWDLKQLDKFFLRGQ